MGVGGWELICATLVSRLFQPGVAGRWHPRAECSLEARVQAPTRWRVPVSPRSCVQTQASLSRGFSLWWASQAEGSEDDWHPGSVPAASRSSLRVPKVPQRSDLLKAAGSCIGLAAGGGAL